MAWQLIYTSAPRLLEAGRSGFGTVARHRQISALLVSAIERASQFARLPGHDADRVIYSHRIIAVAGGRFHVLSCIRDAGADYTGRTNHLAHHLIAEPREVAALGTRGPSPADVLLGMKWAASWEDAPRYLDAVDELALADFPPTSTNEWAQTTGDARNAWLLASGEASRGAYLLHTPGSDLRALLAESLRLAPDRLWQIPFTTTLQPSDEPSDFRWIGIETTSALRAQAEASTRPLLDLTRPETLPAPDVPANALTIGVPRPTARSTTAPANPLPSAPAPRTPAPRPAAHASPARTAFPQTRTLLLIGVGVLLVACGAWLIRDQLAGRADIAQRQEALRRKVADWRTFPPRTADVFRQVRAEQLSSAEQILDEVGKALVALKSGRLDDLRELKSGEELRQTAATFGFAVPAELSAFMDQVRRFESLHRAMTTSSGTTERAAYDATQRQRGEIDQLAKDVSAISAFSPALEELRATRERAEATALLALLHPRGSSSQRLAPTEAALVKERIARGKPADANAAKIFGEAEKLLKAWELVKATSPARGVQELSLALRESPAAWPDWLIQEAESRLGNSTPEPAKPAPVAPRVSETPLAPLYFFQGTAALKDTPIPEIGKEATFQLRSPAGAPPIALLDPTKQNSLRRKISEPPLFTLDFAAGKILPERQAEELAKPFVISVRSGGKDSAQLWIVSESEKPLLSRRTGGLTRSGNSLLLDAGKLGLAGPSKSRMTLRLPADLALAGARFEPMTVADWRADLAPALAEIDRAQKALDRQVKAIESNTATPDSADAAPRVAEGRKVISDALTRHTQQWALVERERIARKENDEKKRAPLLERIDVEQKQRLAQMQMQLGPDTEPLFRQVGGCIKALSQEATFQGHDALYTAGAELSFIAPDAKPEVIAKACGVARKEVQSVLRNLVTSEERARYTASLRTIDAMLLLVSPETADTKKERAKSANALAIRQEELKRLSAHPLLGEAAPSGIYRLSVLADGVEVTLMEIEVTR